MHVRTLFAALGAAAILIGPGAAFAATIVPGVYDLLDHGFGSQGPDYGLRVDSIGKIFSVEQGGASTQLSWGGGATASITGTLYDNATGDIWDVVYNLSGVTGVAGGFMATGGAGTLTDPSSNVFVMSGEADSSGSVFDFVADGHRIPGDTTTPVGRGWLLPPGSTDDWLVRAVPEPGTALLLGLGLAGIAIQSRRFRR